MTRLQNAFAFMAVLALLGCSSGSSTNKFTPVPPGNPQENGSPSPTPTPEPSPTSALRNGFWGRVDARFEVKDTGARLELGCAHGDIPERIMLDDHHSFSVKGTYTAEGGPEPRDGRPSVPAVYQGRVSGDFAADILHLTVIVNGSSTFSYDLSYGVSQMPIKCL